MRIKARRGIVLSDLHLFARRSRGADCLDSLRRELASAEVLVLNGDIFDFRWSTLRDVETTVFAALDWLRQLADEFSNCEVHYLLGNHDCLTPFRQGLTALASTIPRLRWYDQILRVGSALFLHGDCADKPMDGAGLSRYREPWENDRQRGDLAARAYVAIDRLGITSFMQERNFPRHRTVERIIFYLDRMCPDWRMGTRDCYFGHTHLPFSNHRHNGVTFHNTGSAIRGMDFNPVVFETQVESGVG